MDLHTKRAKGVCLAAAGVLLLIAILSLFVGKYPLALASLMQGDALQWKVFSSLRLTRVAVGVIGGFALGVCGFVFQTVFRNPLAAPDVVGVTSGASAGAAFGILFLGGVGITVSAFFGGMAAVLLALALASLDRSGQKATVVLSGVAVHALAQSVLMFLKLTADPERELASIEYWIMGSLSGISRYTALGNLILCLICLLLLFFLYRQIILLSGDEGEARLLGMQVGRVRLIVLLVATLATTSIISMTGVISFIGLLAPHGARLFLRSDRRDTMLLSGLVGGILLCLADLLARTVSSSELPVSIFTSLLGAPFLAVLAIRRWEE